MRKRMKQFWISLRLAVSRTVLVKYLAVTASVIIICCFALGLALLAFVSDRWQHEQQKQLAENAENIAYLAGRTAYMSIQSNDGKKTYTYTFTDRVTDVLTVVGSSIEADIFVVNLDGNTVLCSEDVSSTAACRHRSHKFSKAFVNTVLEQKTDFRSTGTLDGIYNEKYFVVGVPIYAQDESGQEVQIGITFAARTARTISTFRSEMTRVFAISIIVAVVLCLLAVYLLIYRVVVEPLRHMAAATNAFARGDFSVRVPVKSQDEIGQLAEAFNNMASSLAVSETMHRSFVANVSHELKTPMTTISGFIHGMLDGVIPPEKHRDYLQKVADEADRLARLVRAMLDLSKIDSGAMKLNKMRFDITEAVFQTIISFEQRIEEKNIDIRGTDHMESLFVDGDPDLIHQVIYNLFENAVKFVNPDGYIELELSERGKDVLFRVRNSGAGIPDEELQHIFERFYKTDRSRSLDKTGVGLGLYIVKTIISLHGGNICARSVVGEYCEFEFYFPKHDHT